MSTTLHEDGGRLVRLARAVGDLGNPFYTEERQRDVWNEASAVGLQLAILLGLLAATVMVWVGGRAGPGCCRWSCWWARWSSARCGRRAT